MAKLEKSITIDAPVDKVFAYMTEVTNLPEIWPSMVEVKNVEKLPNGASNFGWVYKMAGARLEGSSETSEFILNQRTVTHSKGGIDSTIIWSFRSDGDQTIVTFSAEYTVPIPVLGKLAEAIIVKQNDREADQLLSNLKAKMEGS